MPGSDDSRIEEILEQWFELQMAGAEPQLDELAKDAPHVIERVRAMLERQGELLGPVEAAPCRRPLPVDKLGDYELKSRIGSGGMGDVYLAREVALDRMVAVKVLRHELAEDRLRRLRFKREAQLTAALDHPNIVPIYGTGEDEGYVFLVMKLLPGVTLDRVPGQWRPREIAAIGVQVGQALHAAHEVEIVHRDIKPGNIQVDGDNAWVLDFGLARGRVDLTLTAHGEAPGTLAYMPPEQLRGSPAGLDPRGDVYSLGATLYQCVAGHPPFEADSPEVLVRQALLHDPKPLDVSAPDRDFWTIIERALEKDPERRFPSAREFAEDLQRFLAGEPIHSRRPSTLTRCVKLARRYRTVTASLMAALLVLFALIPKLWLDARERDADLNRQLDAVQEFLDESVPAMALGRLRDLEQRSDALESHRFHELASLTRATLMRDALLDRIQIACVYRQALSDEEFVTPFRELPEPLQTNPATIIAWLYLARERGEGERALHYLDALDQQGSCPRLVAAWRAHDAGEDLKQALAKVPPGSKPVEDHVFTAVLLRMIDASSDDVRSETLAAVAIDAEHPRAGLMLAISHLIGGAPKRAAEVLQLLVDRKRPRAEVQVALATLANAAGQPARAQQHLEAAKAALQVTERPANRWVALQQVLQLILSGQLPAAGDTLARARAQFGDDEWFSYARARLHVERGEIGEARDLFRKLVTEAVVPWNRRRAAAILLQIDADHGDGLSPPDAERLVARAEALADEADVAGDKGAIADAMVTRAHLARALWETFEGEGLQEQSTRWEKCYWDSLRRVLAAMDQHEEAIVMAGEYLVHRIVNLKGTAVESLPVGGGAAQIGRLATTLARRGYHGDKLLDKPVSVTVLAAMLSAYVGSDRAALEMGSIAADLLPREESVDEDERASLAHLLGLALHKLERKEWPPAPPRSVMPK